jgi:tRNA A-37 threonylcarbamoyl transferase component Bud32
MIWSLLAFVIPGIALVLVRGRFGVSALARGPCLYVNPRYRDMLKRHGLDGFDRLQALPAVIVSGHPDRHAAQVTVGAGPDALGAFVKREHRVSWKTRLANARAGFGWVSRSLREYRVLEALRAAGVGCPEPIAAGEDGQGRAFLMLRELTGTLDLRAFLRDRLAGRPHERRPFARHLGEALAQLHDAGFDHPDLYSKHVLVDLFTNRFLFLDWQRSRKQGHVTWQRRWHDLAALDATLPAELASPRDRLLCLRAYLRAAAQTRVPRFFIKKAVFYIQRLSRRLQRKRRIRELCRPALARGAQNLIWLKGEALCVTRAFRDEVRGRIPDWLQAPAPDPRPRNQVRQAVVSLPQTPRARLVRRWADHPVRWLWACLRRRPLTSPELEQAGTLFRLQRFGVVTPRLLAVGQHHPRPWRTESFLLTAAPAGATPLAAWLAAQAGRPLWTSERKQRRRRLREAADVLRRMHDAGCHAGCFGAKHFLVRPGVPSDGDPVSQPAVMLGSLEGIHTRRHFRSLWVRRDLAALHRAFAHTLGSRTDELRFFLAYLGVRRLTPAAKRLARQVQDRHNRLSHGKPEEEHPACSPAGSPHFTNRGAGK